MWRKTRPHPWTRRNTRDAANELVARYEAARDGYEKASREISDRQGKRKTYMRFIGGLQRLDGFCGKFDEELWTALLDYATVYARDDIRFVFKNGREVKASAEGRMCKSAI